MFENGTCGFSSGKRKGKTKEDVKLMIEIIYQRCMWGLIGKFVNSPQIVFLELCEHQSPIYDIIL